MRRFGPLAADAGYCPLAQAMRDSDIKISVINFLIRVSFPSHQFMDRLDMFLKKNTHKMSLNARKCQIFVGLTALIELNDYRE